MTPPFLPSGSQESFLKWFFLSFLTLYFCLSFAPQFFHHALLPATMTPLLTIGGDLYADYCSAKQMLLGYSGHFANPLAHPIYPYPIGGIIHNYGSLVIILMAPLTVFHFHDIYIGWFFISLAILFFLCSKFIRNSLTSQNSRSRFFIALVFFILFTSLSGPINLLLERGQLEIIIPFLLYFVAKDFISEKESWKTAVLLGLAIHIKLWPLALLSLFLRGRKFKLLALAISFPIFLNLIFNPWLPLSDLIHSIRQYNEAAHYMVGWLSISLYSLLTVLGISVSWKILPVLFYLIMNAIALYLLTRTAKNEALFRSLFFCFVITYSLLTPAFICAYTLAIILVLMILMANAAPLKIVAILFALLNSNLLVFGQAAGPIQTVCLLCFLMILLFQLYHALSTNTPGSRLCIL